VRDRHAGPVGEVQVGRGVEHREIGRRTDPDDAEVISAQRRGTACGAAHTASAAVIRSSRTARAITNGIELVLDVPGLVSVASATVTPASSSARASG
jgi:hypothetical protein